MHFHREKSCFHMKCLFVMLSTYSEDIFKTWFKETYCSCFKSSNVCCRNGNILKSFTYYTHTHTKTGYTTIMYSAPQHGGQLLYWITTAVIHTLISIDILTTDKWSEYQWLLFYSAMECWETLDTCVFVIKLAKRTNDITDVWQMMMLEDML